MLAASKVPKWAHYPYIYTGYRAPSNTGNYLEALLTLFQWHNETLNAWTMIAAWLISSATYGNILYTSRHNMTWAQHSACAALYLSCLLHMPMSVSYHTFCYMSEGVKAFWLRMDVGFILLACVLQTYATAILVMRPEHVRVLLTLITSIATYGINKLHTQYSTVTTTGELDHKKDLSLLVGTASVVSHIPVMYGAFILRDVRWMQAFVGVSMSLALGVVVYVFAIPERWSATGRFDMVGQSNQIMHVMVTIAHLFEWWIIAHVNFRN
jgi:predicted membrane channel-forming protein YqfA (hemolysin III family)